MDHIHAHTHTLVSTVVNLVYWSLGFGGTVGGVRSVNKDLQMLNSVSFTWTRLHGMSSEHICFRWPHSEAAWKTFYIAKVDGWNCVQSDRQSERGWNPNSSDLDNQCFVSGHCTAVRSQFHHWNRSFRCYRESNQHLPAILLFTLCCYLGSSVHQCLASNPKTVSIFQLLVLRCLCLLSPLKRL